jgi:hypothetical protein
LFSLAAPCLGIVVYLLGRRAFNDSPNGMLVFGTISSLVATAGFIFGVVAYFAPKRDGEGVGTMGKAIAGIVINGLLIAFAILSTKHQKVSASENNTPEPPRKGSSYLSGR